MDTPGVCTPGVCAQLFDFVRDEGALTVRLVLELAAISSRNLLACSGLQEFSIREESSSEGHALLDAARARPLWCNPASIFHR